MCHVLLTPHSSPILYLSQSQWSSHPPLIAILLLPFPFQPFAFKWFLVILFFFLLVPKSLLQCCCCFGPVFVQSSAIYAASPLYSEVSCLFFRGHWAKLPHSQFNFSNHNCILREQTTNNCCCV